MDIRIFAILCIVTKSVSFLFVPVPRLALNNRLYSVPKGQEQEDSVTYFAPNSDINDLKSRDTSIGSDEDLESDSIDLSTNEYSFFDEAIIFVRAGSGGQGSSTYKKGVGGQQGPPDGGDGGRGGNVILLMDESLNTLAGLTQGWRPNSFGGSGATKNQELAVRPKSFRAESGSDGDRRLKNGAWGQDVIIRVPPGTMIQEEIDIISEEGKVCSVDHITLGSINMETPRLIIARGGDGGEGSGVAGKFYGRGVKRLRNPPVRGERKRLKLILKIVADVALVGVPNAGKSTFLASVTRAKPKIANYPFTTVIPNLGVWIPSEENKHGENSHSSDATTLEGSGSAGLILCDVPGLVAGASKGVGLGLAFLRHVERCHVILHIVDATSNDPIADFEMLNREICQYGSGHLANMPQVVVINKIDVYEGKTEDWEKGLVTRYSREELESMLKNVMTHSRLMSMSAKDKDGVDELMSRLASFVIKVKQSKL